MDSPNPDSLETAPFGGEATPAFAAAARDWLGVSYDGVAAFGALLERHGIERGLLGPRELGRLWERHLLNSAAVVPFVGKGSVVDVGSGAGLPGIVVAIMRPEQRVWLVEPMERRASWLTEVAKELELPNVTVVRGRAEEMKGSVIGDSITARAVAPIEKLVKWCAPLLAEGGTMALLKGRSAPAEIESAKYALKRAGLTARVVEAPTMPGLESTSVVTIS